MIKCPKCGTDYDGAERFCPKDGTRLDEDRTSRISLEKVNDDPLIDTIIQGRYRVIDRIGEGGMGVVYVAEHVEIEKKVALKVLRDDFSKRPEVVARFRQEAKSASKIGNAHIVDVTDFGQIENGGVYFVMEHLKGKGLSDVIRSEVIHEKRAVNIVLQIARALKAAHKLGIVHRDLKPENIFLVDSDEQKDFVKILDFGIAKISDRDSEGQRLTKTGMIFGTPEYMSPEQASGKPLDHRVDIYALGCIMFEMFTGEVPYEGETFMAVLTQHMFEPIPRVDVLNPQTDVRQSVRDVVYKAMAKDKDERYQDMESLARDLERAMEGSWEFPNEGLTGDFAYSGSNLKDTAETRLKWSAERRIVEGSRKKKGLIVALAIGIIGIAGIATAYINGYLTEKNNQEVERHSGEEIEDKPSEISSKREIEQKKTEKETEIDSNETREEASDPMNLKIETVKIAIDTTPEDAVIFVEGMGQVCSKSPCEISLKTGIPKKVIAKKNGSSSEITITPSEQNKEVHLKIEEKKEKKRVKAKNREKKKEKKNKNENGLKIPDIFKNN